MDRRAKLKAAVQPMVKTRSTRGQTPSQTGYEPVAYLERHVPLHERIAFLAAADVAVVTATRDGMNLLPYEYVVCR
jgi:trehalose-6-phosphate synthase